MDLKQPEVLSLVGRGHGVAIVPVSIAQVIWLPTIRISPEHQRASSRWWRTLSPRNPAARELIDMMPE